MTADHVIGDIGYKVRVDSATASLTSQESPQMPVCGRWIQNAVHRFLRETAGG